MKRLFAQILLIFCTVLASSAGELPVWVSKSRPLTASALRIPAYSHINESFMEKGTARLIVRLTPPSVLTGGFVIEGHLIKSEEIFRQRAHIAVIQDRVSKLLSKQHADRVKKFDFIPFMALEATQSEFEALIGSSDIEYIQEDIPVPPTLYSSVPLIGGLNGAFIGFSGSGQTVAILDTGVEKFHPFLGGKIVAEACFSSSYAPDSATPLCTSGSTVSGSAIPCASSLSSSCRHGTHVAGIAAGSGGTFSGSPFSGVAKDASIIAIQVFSRVDDAIACGGTSPCILSYSSDQISAMNHIYSLRNMYNIASVNMSLGGGSYSTNCDGEYAAEKAAIDLLRSADIVTIISSGNDGSTASISAPACISTAISVGGTDKSDKLYSNSNIAPILNLLAPGVSIYSSIPGAGVYATMTGTSMAAPHVTGAWAVLKSTKPAATVNELLAALSSTGKLITDTRTGGSISKPRIQLSSAVLYLKPPEVPSVVTSVATNVASHSATLNGFVADNRSNTTVSFDYGLNMSYGTNIPATTGVTVLAGAGLSSSSVAPSSLACNTTYHYRVKAINSVGTSYGNDLIVTTTACVPGAPTISSVTAGNTQASLYFSPPVSDGGSAILNYTVMSSSGVSSASDSIPITVTGLTNGISYTFTVTATNAAGTGSASGVSESVIPGIVVIDDSYTTGYQLLQNAYDADTSEKKIMLQADTEVGGLVVDSSHGNRTINIKGGYDKAFLGDDGRPSILGKIILSTGTTRVKNVIVRSP